MVVGHADFTKTEGVGHVSHTFQVVGGHIAGWNSGLFQRQGNNRITWFFMGVNIALDPIIEGFMLFFSRFERHWIVVERKVGRFGEK